MMSPERASARFRDRGGEINLYEKSGQKPLFLSDKL